MGESIWECFHLVRDPRVERTRKHISIDGKTLRHSFDTASGRAAIHMVSAWVYEDHACFGQVNRRLLSVGGG